MGTTLATFLLSLLLLFSSSCCVVEAQFAVPSSVTAKAAAIQYWKLKFPNSKPLPPFFLSKLSTLSPLQIAARFHTDHPDTASSEGRGSPNNIKMVTSDANSSENYFVRHQTDTSGSTSSNFDDGYANSSDNYFPRYDAETDSSTSSNFDDGGAVTTVYANSSDNYFPRYDAETDSSTSSNFDDSGAITTVYANSSDNYFPKYDAEADSSTSSNFDDGGAITTVYANSSDNYFPRYDAETDSSTSSNFDDNGATASYKTESGNGTSSDFDDSGATASYQTESGSNTSSNFDDSGAITSGYPNSSNNYFIRNHTTTSTRTSSNFEDNKATTSDNADSSHDNKNTLVNRNRNSHRHNVPLGVFFRESDLKKGTAMRVQFRRVEKIPLDPHFLPRSVASEIPFSANAVKQIFHVSSSAETATGKAVDASIALCEMPPNEGETKRCISSAEDMMDFVLESLGSDNVQVRSTTNFNGAGHDILIGDVKAMNDGKFIETLTCHQLKFPYLLHHCHIVPKSKLYEVDVLEIGTKKKINHAAAICHVDTSSWGAGHAAFLVLGSAPGKIEVCHWIFPQDMAWTAAATQ